VLNPNVWWVTNTADSPADVHVTFSSCDNLEAIESLQVWGNVSGNPVLMIEIKEGTVTRGSSVYTQLSPGQEIYFYVWGQAYRDTSVSLTTLTLEVTLETEEVEATPPPSRSKREEAVAFPAFSQILIVVVILGVALALGSYIGSR